jgi:hypothetical protein
MQAMTSVATSIAGPEDGVEDTPIRAHSAGNLSDIDLIFHVLADDPGAITSSRDEGIAPAAHRGATAIPI